MEGGWKMVYANEIIQELEEGNTYTSKQLENFIKFNRNVIVVSDKQDYFPEIDSMEFMVKHAMRGYYHSNDGGKSVHYSGAKRVYLVERV
jgi:hypothetical protein